jgi:transcriptional regulator with PAS, ATPase and Fis domain
MIYGGDVLNFLLWTQQEQLLLTYLTKISRGMHQEPSSTIDNGMAPELSAAIHLLNALLNSPHEKVIITDRDGNILFINEAYAQVISVCPEEVIGKNVIHVLGRDTRMHIVGKTLKADLHGLFHTANADAVARRFPLISKGRVLGVMGKDLFDNFADLHLVAQQAHELRKNYSYAGKRLVRTNQAKYNFEDIVTQDPIMLKMKERARHAAMTNSTVILLGETGVGKELFAHAIHQESKQKNNPFISINCGAMPETLLESELFGYDDGAFTGARKGGKPGKFELADGGTLFLDEIGDIPLTAQVKLLRVLQEKEIERVGGIKTVPVNVRVIASTNCNLLQFIKEGKFREDLFYRLNVVSFTIPPLRERLGDIPLLAQFFVEKYNQAFGRHILPISKSSLKQLRRYHWPGNVRQLESTIEAAMNRIPPSASEFDDCFHFDPLVQQQHLTTLKDKVEQTEADTIRATLHGNGWDIGLTAKQLEISSASLYRRMKKYGI